MIIIIVVALTLGLARLQIAPLDIEKHLPLLFFIVGTFPIHLKTQTHLDCDHKIHGVNGVFVKQPS